MSDSLTEIYVCRLNGRALGLSVGEDLNGNAQVVLAYKENGKLLHILLDAQQARLLASALTIQARKADG